MLTRLPVALAPAPAARPTEGVGTTVLAQAVNRAMADDATARAAYAAIYGVAWEPLPYFATELSTELSTPHFASGTNAVTRC